MVVEDKVRISPKHVELCGASTKFVYKILHNRRFTILKTEGYLGNDTIIFSKMSKS